MPVIGARLEFFFKQHLTDPDKQDFCKYPLVGISALTRSFLHSAKSPSRGATAENNLRGTEQLID